jgi:hypothetical protein
MLRYFSLLTLLVSLSVATAQDVAPVEYDGHAWRVAVAPNGAVKAGVFKGRDALYISRGQAWRDDLNLGDVVIDYDIAPTMKSGFMGVNFRASADGNMEQFYIRGHLSGHDDATQYQPVHNGLSSWQIYGGPNDIRATNFEPNTWTHVRIVAIGDAADIFVGDQDEPLLHVVDLKATTDTGAFGLFMGDRPWIEGSGAWFSNVSIRETGPKDRLVGSPREEPALPTGLITDWSVSATFDEKLLADRYDLPDGLDQGWQAASLEPNGVLNIARLTPVASEANTVLVRTVIHAKAGEIKRLKFGYSDRVKLYLNGQEIFAGNAGWRSRDHRHLGTITWVDTVPLRLRQGKNELTAAVSESFGGWGFTGALEE